jgi:hypothetical protein
MSMINISMRKIFKPPNTCEIETPELKSGYVISPIYLKNKPNNDNLKKESIYTTKPSICYNANKKIESWFKIEDSNVELFNLPNT